MTALRRGGLDNLMSDTFKSRMQAIVREARAKSQAERDEVVARWLAVSQGVALLLGALHRAGWERDEAYAVCGPAFDALAEASRAALLMRVKDVRLWVKRAELVFEAARRAVEPEVEKGWLV